MTSRKGLSFDTVLKLGRELPEVESSTSWGAPALKVRGTMFACGATHTSAEPNTLVVRMGIDQRDALVADAPDTYYLKEHYVNYACVLVRLDRVREDALRDLLLTGWRYVTERQRLRKRRPGRGPARGGERGRER
jgi:hypothetical protein